ncbi:hypothetical protein QTP88_028015 [Uroleucon formosanum]
MSKDEPPSCETCGQRLTIKHILTECLIYEQERLELNLTETLNYNPIELIWAQVKSEMAKKIDTFKMVDVERLTNEALDSVSKSDWEKCVEHAEKIQDEDYEKEILRDS